MITFDIIIFISSIILGITLYWLEVKSNRLYRSFNKLFNSKELQMNPTSKKGFLVKQEFMPRFIYVNIFLLLIALIIFLLPVINIRVEYYVSALFGVMIGVYIAHFMIGVKDRSEELFDKVVDSSKEFFDDIKEKGKEASAHFSSKKEEEEETTPEEETPKTEEKSARERLKDKGLLK